jgi:hypothetical protein
MFRTVVVIGTIVTSPGYSKTESRVRIRIGPFCRAVETYTSVFRRVSFATPGLLRFPNRKLLGSKRVLFIPPSSALTVHHRTAPDRTTLLFLSVSMIASEESSTAMKYTGEPLNSLVDFRLKLTSVYPPAGMLDTFDFPR